MPPNGLSHDALLERLRTSREEVSRKLSSMPTEAFEGGRDESGWNARQILAHIASMEWTYARLVDVAREARSAAPPPAGEAPPPAHRPARSDNESYNERQVAKRAGATVQELIEEFDRNRAATIKAVEEADEALMDTPVRTAFGVEAPLAAALNYVAVVHVEEHLQDIARHS